MHEDIQTGGPATAPEIRALPFVLVKCEHSPVGPWWKRLAAVENLERAEIEALGSPGVYALKNAAGTIVAFLASDGRRVESSKEGE